MLKTTLCFAPFSSSVGHAVTSSSIALETALCLALFLHPIDPAHFQRMMSLDNGFLPHYAGRMAQILGVPLVTYRRFSLPGHFQQY